MLESRIQAQIVKKARNLGCIAVKIDASMTGWPDLTVITPDGTTLLIEVKQERGRLSKVQLNTHRKLREHNANITTVYSVPEGVAYILRYIGEPTPTD